MNKEKYIEKSISLNLPHTCPIYDYCERRANTIFANSYYGIGIDNGSIKQIVKDGYLPEDYFGNEIKMRGEEPTFSKNGYEFFSCSNMCPEVNLFDDENSMFKGVACTDGNYTFENKKNFVKIIKTKHFSECDEFKKFKSKY